MVSAKGNLLPIVDNISLIAAPVGAVIIPILLGILGIAFLCSSLNKPSLANFSFNFSNSIYKAPNPSTSILSTYI